MKTKPKSINKSSTSTSASSLEQGFHSMKAFMQGLAAEGEKENEKDSLKRALDEALEKDDFSDIFPTLKRKFSGRDLAFIDNAAGTLKPVSVARAIAAYYLENGANAHRGVFRLSLEATERIEESRRQIQKLLHAEKAEEIIFTDGTTGSFNLLAGSLIRSPFLQSGDEVIVSAMEHHANLIPWQRLAEENGVVLKFIRVTSQGELDRDHFRKLLNRKAKLLSLVHISNSLGTVNDIKGIIKEAKEQGLLCAIDAAQSIAHGGIYVDECKPDFICFSMHKMFGPTGIGVLYGRHELLKQMPAMKLGGGGINKVTLKETIYSNPPSRFEAGTANIAGLYGILPALDFINSFNYQRMLLREKAFIKAVKEEFSRIPFVQLLGDAKERSSVFSFVIDGVHAHDAGSIFDDMAVAVRVGHHCTQPIINQLGHSAAIRASFSAINSMKDVHRLVEAIYKAKEVFS